MALGIALILLSTGCASLAKRSPADESSAAGREFLRQGVAATEMNQWGDAERLLRSALDVSPENAAARWHLAEALWQRGAINDALLQIETALQLDPRNAPLAVRAGEMQLSTGHLDEALVLANQAIGCDPALADAWTLRGRAYWHLQEEDRALADLHRALQSSPHAGDVLLDIAAVYRRQGRHNQCLVTLHHLFDNTAPENRPQLAFWLEGQTLADQGRWDDAIESLQAAARRGQPNAEIFYHLAQAQFATGRMQDASAAAQQALATDASHGPSRDFLVRLSAVRSASAAEGAAPR